MSSENEYGYLQLNIEDILKEKGISKNKLCKDMDIPRSNLNRYCQQKAQRLDTGLLCKLCSYLNCNIEDIITYHPKDKNDT